MLTSRKRRRLRVRKQRTRGFPDYDNSGRERSCSAFDGAGLLPPLRRFRRLHDPIHHVQYPARLIAVRQHAAVFAKWRIVEHPNSVDRRLDAFRVPVWHSFDPADESACTPVVLSGESNLNLDHHHDREGEHLGSPRLHFRPLPGPGLSVCRSMMRWVIHTI